MLYLVLTMTMFPQISVLSGLFVMLKNLGLFNTRQGLVVTYLIFTMPFTIWVMTQYFRGLPKELEEAAYVDGATPLTVFWQILLPLTMPGLISTGLLAFIAAWNEFLFALTFTVTDTMKTVPVVISQFSGTSSFEQPWGSIMAASMVVTIPLVILVMIFQYRIVAGLTAGAVKGSSLPVKRTFPSLVPRRRAAPASSKTESRVDTDNGCIRLLSCLFASFVVF